jgi:hypothetical protein
MISDAPNNKMIDPAADDTGKVTLKAVSVIKNEYHFPGGPLYKPQGVIANTYEEALAIWKTTRIPVTPEPEKVEVVAEAEKTITNETK